MSENRTPSGPLRWRRSGARCYYEDDRACWGYVDKLYDRFYSAGVYGRADWSGFELLREAKAWVEIVLATQKKRRRKA